ncbi:inactive pancreatic lipase-related protein 1-like [Culicoides brevitarsis]|uniref:inactive pancreatic lipase-related protein 1-like n=1 Tax=Culicoides brevitarsis TaxID=469753 RepID=UPI00307BF2AA
MFGTKFEDIPIADDATTFKFDAYRDVEFELYTTKNPKIFQRVLIDDQKSLLASNFNPAHPTRLIIHGASTNGTSESITYPRNGYLKRGDFNVFGVNWGKGSSFSLKLPKRMKAVGEIVAKFIYFLIREGGASMDDMGIVGHSAGANIVSFVGKSTNGDLPLLVSQDPPRSFSKHFYGKSLPEKSDAKYVEVLHTAARKNSIFTREAVGHADYYPNGGADQPYCKRFTGNDRDYCNHMIAIAYFAEAIASEKGFWAKRCKTWVGIDEGKCEFDGVVKKMGGEPVDKTPGVFYLETEEDYPFAKGI